MAGGRRAATVALAIAIPCVVASASCTAILGIEDPIDEGAAVGGDSSSPEVGDTRFTDSTPTDTRLDAPSGDTPPDVIVDGGFDSSADTTPPDTTPIDTTPIDTGVSCAGKPDGTVCGSSPRSICLGGSCRWSACPDGFVDTGAGEECDDGNALSGDGCDNDCTWTCNSAKIPSKTCPGTFCAPEGCTGSHNCVAGLEPCAPPVSCKTETCNEAARTCGSPTLIDGDGDSYGPTSSPPVPPCTDCDDTNAAVHPFQTAWFTMRSAAGSWDYDCDGSIAQEFDTGTCALNVSSTGCDFTPGFVDSPPPTCGVSGDYIDTCTLGGGTVCTTTTITRTQGCH